MGAEGINSRKNDLEHINQIVCFKKSTQKNLTLKQSEKVLNFRDTQTYQRHFIIICIIIIKNGENLQRMHMRANVLISVQLSMAKSLSPYLQHSHCIYNYAVMLQSRQCKLYNRKLMIALQCFQTWRPLHWCFGHFISDTYGTSYTCTTLCLLTCDPNLIFLPFSSAFWAKSSMEQRLYFL